MNRKISAFVLSATMALSAFAPDAIADYCTSPALTRTSGGRNLNSLTVSDESGSCTVTVNQSPNYGAASYFDMTGTKLQTLPGATIRFTAINWTGEWMHSYAYVDYDGNEEFNTVLNTDGSTSGELVSYSYLATSPDNEHVGTDSNGNDISSGAGVSAANMPSFKLRNDLPAGDYRIRFKIDWNSANPCGATIAKDGGCIVDFTLSVQPAAEHTVSIKSSDESLGTVSFEGLEGTSVVATDPVTIVATPAAGYMFKNWTNDATSAVFATTAKAVVGGAEDISLTANFGDVEYAGMTHTFTNNASQSNRYLRRVTTTGTRTPEVFSATTADKLPYTAWSSSAGTYVESGALIDKTSTPIEIEHGTRSFTMTYYAWTSAIGSYSSQINWTQEAYFVDWNKNGQFDDEGEISDKGNTSMPNAAIISTDGMTRTVSVPAGIDPGTYRMRVVFFEPANSGEDWPHTLFGSLGRKIRNGLAYDFDIIVGQPKDMTVASVSVDRKGGYANPGANELELGYIDIVTEGTLNPASKISVKANYTGTSAADLSNLRLIYSTTGNPTDDVVASAASCPETMTFDINKELSHGHNYFILLADINDEATLGDIISFDVTEVKVDGTAVEFTMPDYEGKEVTEVIDYTLGNALWFDSANSSTTNVAIWNRDDFSTSSSNPDQIWERKSFPIGNGSIGGNIIGSVNRERVVLNEKTLWRGGPGTGAAAYWNMNNTVSDATLAQIRSYLASGNTYSANSMVSSNYRGKIDYTAARFGSYTALGEAYISTGINESAVTDYKRILNIDRSIAVVQFKSGDNEYQRRYFASYPDSVMVWRFTSIGEAQNLTFSFATPQTVRAVTAKDGGLLYTGIVANNNMKWAMRVYVRTNDGGTVTPNASARTISVSGSNDVEFIIAADTDYKMNFDPSTTDNAAFVGDDPADNVNAIIDAAAQKSYDELYATHLDDYTELYGRVKLEINPSEKFSNLPTPTRLRNYSSGTLDHALEQQYFQYGRYLLISSSRAGNMPANLQGMWHNNFDGPWRVDYHNNINLQMNYWPATCTNLLECFKPFIDYVRGLVKPGERTAKAYYGARGWTAEVSTNIFGFTAPLNSTDMSWNYNPTAGPWLATQIWEYYDYTRDKKWLEEIGYPIIKSSADFVSDLLYKHGNYYTSAPSYSPEHGTCDLGATYANAVTREVLIEAIKAAGILGVDEASVEEWQEKLDAMYPYQVGRYGQLQEWYNDIDTYNDTHRHTNHLFGLHPGSTINALTDTELVDACKETLRQRGDAATGWSMGWKLNHWARLLDGDHAYTLFQNLLKNGTAENMWDLHPPFQIDGNFGGTAGISELFLQSQNGKIHLLPALPSAWTDGKVTGLRTRGNFEVDVHYADGKLSRAVITSNAGEDCDVYYNGKEKTFPTEAGGVYTVTYNDVTNELEVDDTSAIEDITDGGDLTIDVEGSKGDLTVVLNGNATGRFNISVYSITGALVARTTVNKTDVTATAPLRLNVASAYYLLNVENSATSISRKIRIN